MVNAAIDIHHDDPQFGYRVVTAELAQQGVQVSGNRVNRLVHLSATVVGAHAQLRSNCEPGPPVHDLTWC
ncbi:transposase [Modestobacter sp. VKM Ac-2978]|uniref:transposase n=1 Tax=Modestobacter sp. VKM Ac-2978 TaxID=3004132 RepID=UPI0022AB2D07|nr:transposase [Modestobacter sp. VKM Ac-2978]MCZ2849867.1 transposase [Modestobacter sp. VKM Ac-2978]